MSRPKHAYWTRPYVHSGLLILLSVGTRAWSSDNLSVGDRVIPVGSLYAIALEKRMGRLRARKACSSQDIFNDLARSRQYLNKC
eukprot:1119917-Amphidinium_carterae.1